MTSRTKVKATLDGNTVEGYVDNASLTYPRGGVVLYKNAGDADGLTFLYAAEDWEIEKVIEVPTNPFAVIRVGDIVMVNLGQHKLEILREPNGYADLPWVRIVNSDGYGNSYSEKYIRDRIAEGKEFTVIYHGEEQ